MDWTIQNVHPVPHPDIQVIETEDPHLIHNLDATLQELKQRLPMQPPSAQGSIPGEELSTRAFQAAHRVLEEQAMGTTTSLLHMKTCLVHMMTPSLQDASWAEVTEQDAGVLAMVQARVTRLRAIHGAHMTALRAWAKACKPRPGVRWLQMVNAHRIATSLPPAAPPIGLWDWRRAISAFGTPCQEADNIRKLYHSRESILAKLQADLARIPAVNLHATSWSARRILSAGVGLEKQELKQQVLNIHALVF